MCQLRCSSDQTLRTGPLDGPPPSPSGTGRRDSFATKTRSQLDSFRKELGSFPWFKSTKTSACHRNSAKRMTMRWNVLALGPPLKRSHMEQTQLNYRGSDPTICDTILHGIDVLYWTDLDRSVMTAHVRETNVPASSENPCLPPKTLFSGEATEHFFVGSFIVPGSVDSYWY